MDLVVDWLFETKFPASNQIVDIDRDSFQAALHEVERQLFLFEEGQGARVGKR